MTLRELEARGVVARHAAGSGTRANVWSFTTNVGHRWKILWRSSGRDVENSVELCSCRAVSPLVARLAGQSVVRSRGQTIFRLPPEAHLGFYPPPSRDYGADRATRSSVAWGSGPGPRDYGAAGEPAIPCFPEVSSTLPLPHEEEEVENSGGEAVARSITELTGQPLVGSPRRRVMTAMATCDLDPRAVETELRRIPSPTFMLCVVRVEDLARSGLPVRVSHGERVPGVDGLRAAGLHEEANALEASMRG